MFQKTKLLVCDFDGVLTNNKVYVDQNGVETVRCDRSDGLGLQRIMKKGLNVLVISKERNPVVGMRCHKIGVPFFQGIDDKVSCLKNYCQKISVHLDEVVYVGNDINDVGCMRIVGVACGVQDSYQEALDVADYVCHKKGGDGAVREICDLVLRDCF